MKKQLGAYGEVLSRKHLINKGYLLLKNNFKNRFGEIDIIAQQNNVMVFIEVKTRNNIIYGLPREAVNYGKQLKIKKVAQQYIQQQKIRDMNFRFDVIEVLWIKDKYEINHIENAF